MRIVRLPGIHHDSNIVLAVGKLGTILVDSGTSWYQALQIERILGIVEDNKLDRILLTSRRYPCSGASSHISQHFDNCPVHANAHALQSLAQGDFFTTWSNRFDSDMPPIEVLPLEGGEIFALGDGQISCMSLPGHSNDSMAYYVEDKKLLISGLILPRADRPARWDLPTGCLPDLVASLKNIKQLKLETLIPFQGPAIKGKMHIAEVLNRHIDFFQSCIDNEGLPPKSWPRPAQTALWLTPVSPWPLLEREEI